MNWSAHPTTLAAQPLLPGISDFPEIEESFELPVFIKGSRLTSKHRAGASIVKSRDDFEKAPALFRSDPILRWQEILRLEAARSD